MIQSFLFPNKPAPGTPKVVTVPMGVLTKQSRRETALEVGGKVQTFAGITYTTRGDSGDIVRRDFNTGNAPYVVVAAGDTSDEQVSNASSDARLVGELLRAIASIQSAMLAVPSGPHANDAALFHVERDARICAIIDVALRKARAAS